MGENYNDKKTQREQVREMIVHKSGTSLADQKDDFVEEVENLSTHFINRNFEKVAKFETEIAPDDQYKRRLLRGSQPDNDYIIVYKVADVYYLHHHHNTVHDRTEVISNTDDISLDWVDYDPILNHDDIDIDN
jgi:hypothetical protein